MVEEERTAPLPTVLTGELLHLDLLRFVASAGIVLVHSVEFLLPRGGRQPLTTQFGVLGLFVDVFFVVSGFVIAHIYSGRIGSARDYGVFLQRRVARLLPLHLLVTAGWIALYAAIALARLTPSHPMSLSPACLATTTLLLTAIVDCGGTPVGGANWSISAELGMYLLFPLFGWLIGDRAWRGLLLSAGLMVGVLSWHGTGSWEAWTDIGRAVPAFVLGIAYHRGRATLARLPVAEWGLAAGVGSLFAVALVPVPWGVSLAIAYLIPAFAIGADQQGRGGARLRRWAPLGQLTYSVYLLHGPVVLVLLNAVADKLLALPLAGMWVAAAVTYVVLAVTSRGSFAWFETPAREAINRLRLFARREPSARVVRPHV